MKEPRAAGRLGAEELRLPTGSPAARCRESPASTVGPLSRAPAYPTQHAPAGPETGPASARTPAAAILGLQRVAGNRAVGRLVGSGAVLSRSVIADVTTTSVGEDFANQLTPEELKEQVALLVDALEHGFPTPAAREAMEQNLEFLQEYGEDHGTALPVAAAHDFRVLIAKHLGDLSRHLAIVKQLTRDVRDGVPFFGAPPPQLEWQVEQLAWITEAAGRAAQLAGEAERGGEGSAGKLAEAGTELTATIFGLKALAILLVYDDFYLEATTHYPGFAELATGGMEMAHEQLEPLVANLRMRMPQFVDPAASQLLPTDERGWAFDFSQRKDRTEEQIEAWDRFMGWVNIALLAWDAFDIWLMPSIGRPGGGGGESPRIGGIGGAGGAAVATPATVLATAETRAALGRLAAIGAITAPKLVESLGGRSGVIKGRSRPIEASGKGNGRGGGRGTGGPGKPHAAGEEGPGRVGADPNKRPTAGLPSPAEDAVLQRYSRGLAELREKSELYAQMKPRPGETHAAFRKRSQPARAAVESALQALDRIEEEALNAADSDLAGHLDPLVKERRTLQTPQGLKATMVGRRIPCGAVKLAPKNLRGMDFAEIDKAMGRPPDGWDPAPAPTKGADAPTSARRLWWRFKDGSKLVVDLPRELGRVHKTGDLPHAELHGPRGERLDPQGIEVPEGSTPAHMTITDHFARLRDFFVKAGKGS